MSVPSYDLIVIGGGPAGLAAAEAAAARGARVALIEKHLLGGASLWSGSVPSKALIGTARLYAGMRHAERYGGTVPGNITENFPAVMQRMHRLRERIGAYQSAERLQLAGIEIFAGAARFTGGAQVSIDAPGVEAKTLSFGKALIATGARPTPTLIPGLQEAGFLTNEQLFDLTELPRRLLVIGGGPLGCEAAQAFCRLGSHVVIAQDEPKFLPLEERDAAQILSESLARDGVEIHLNTTVVAVRMGDAGEKLVDLVSDDITTTVAVDHILAGVGRMPNVDGLNLEQAGVQYDAKNGIRVDDFLRSSNRRIYAAGDVCLMYKFTHVAQVSAKIAVANALFKGRNKFSSLIIPWCTYTDPQIAHVGMYASVARDNAVPVKTFTVLMHDIDRAILDGQERGFVKIHVRQGTDSILGATIVATHAGEMINEITLAMDAGLGLAALAHAIHAYPTQASAIQQVAEAYLRSQLAGPPHRDIDRPPWPFC